MVYQVLTRQCIGNTWRAQGAVTSDRQAAQLALHQVRRYFAGAMLVEAETAVALAAQIRRLREDGGAAVETPGARIIVAHAPMRVAARTPGDLAFASREDARRWEVERGPGGDHDRPYRFELPMQASVMQRWLALLAHAQRDIVA